jgi:pimeloyl-ACP methyl ester carboxylesterase
MARQRRVRRTVPRRPTKPPESQPGPWSLNDHVVEESLLTGDHSNDLDALFGEAGHEELQQLARQAAAARRRGGPKVLVLPGIMGSKLGVRRTTLKVIHDDVYWLNPVRFTLGIARSLQLAPNGNPGKIVPLGVFLSVYLKLKLSLVIAGYDAELFPYDWRLPIAESGKLLRDKIRSFKQSVSLVAHSMGGLVARAAVRAGADVERLIMLGTPNYGSFAPIQALRGVYPVVKKLAALDVRSSAVDLATIFASFDGLCQMFPSPMKYPTRDFFSPASWPKSLPKISPNVVKRSAQVQAVLAAANSNRPFYLIAGYNQDTVVGAGVNEATDEFEYELSSAGDGTVPLQLALLEDTTTYYVEESHGLLPNNGKVIKAVKDILSDGETKILPTTVPALRSTSVRRVAEASLRSIQEFDRRSPQNLRSVELRNIIAEVAAPIGQQISVSTVESDGKTEPTIADKWKSLTVSRPKQRYLEVRFVRGSITDVDTRAYALGLFRAVTPTGAAAFIDAQLDGVITEFTQRRMFNSNVGEVFVMPANRRLRADMVVFVGLGPFDGFNDSVQQVVAENLLRTLVRTNVEEFATVLFGGASGADVGKVLENLMRGFIRALNDVDDDERFRRITICELDQDRYRQICNELYRLASTPLFDGVEISFTEPDVVKRSDGRSPDSPIEPRDSQRKSQRGSIAVHEPIYLLVRQEMEDPRANPGTVTIRSSLLATSAKAATISDSQVIDKADLDAIYDQIDGGGVGFANLPAFGKEWTKRVLPDSICKVLPSSRDYHLVIVHDAESSRLPWETLHFTEDGDWIPAVEAGISHRYLANNFSVTKFLEARRKDKSLDMLLIVDPSQTLDGAVREAQRIEKLFGLQPDVNLTRIGERDGTRPRLIKELSSGKYDVVHYAGHAMFDPQERSRSGILCANDQILSGADLSGLANLPSLVFFNACESARVRAFGRRGARKPDRQQQKLAGIGFAEAFLRGGVANFVGTYWEVGDLSAETFADVFYRAVLAGDAMGDAVLKARKKLRELKQVDWADYIHYGSHQFRVKDPDDRS